MAGGDRKVNIRFTGDAGVLKGSAGELRTLFQNLVNDVDDNRLAGDKWADAFRQQSDRIRQEMDDIRTTADVLADSLGPEMVQALEAQGRSVEQQVQELKKMGLSYDDIKMSSGEIATALRDRDDALRQSTGTVGDGFKKVREEADQTRSVVANFAGNAIQELPGVAGALGPLNMAIGQFGEYAAEGNIQLKNFAGAAVGLGAVSLVMKGIADHSKKVAETKAWRTDEVKGYEAALKDVDTVYEAVLKKITDAGGLKIDILDTRGDLLPALNNIGLTVDQTAKLIAGGNDVIKAWADSMKAAGADAENVNFVVMGLSQQVDLLSKAQKNAEASSQFFATATRDVADESRGATMRIGDMAGALDKAAQNTHSLTDEFKDLFDELDQADALDNVADAFDSIKSTAEDAWIATTEGADDAMAKQRDYAGSIRDTKREVILYADELGNVPTEVVSKVLTLIDQGKFDEAKLIVASWANQPLTKTVDVVAKFKGSNIPIGGGKAFASGTESAPPGVALVGEQGPELVLFGGGEKVLTASRTNSLLSATRTGNVYHITVNAAGADAREVARILAEEVRRNGGTLG